MTVYEVEPDIRLPELVEGTYGKYPRWRHLPCHRWKLEGEPNPNDFGEKFKDWCQKIHAAIREYNLKIIKLNVYPIAEVGDARDGGRTHVVNMSPEYFSFDDVSTEMARARLWLFIKDKLLEHDNQRIAMKKKMDTLDELRDIDSLGAFARWWRSKSD